MTVAGAWPGAFDPGDPFADEPIVASGHLDYVEGGGTLERDAYDHVEATFRAELARCLAGLADPRDRLVALAHTLRLDGDPRRVPYPPEPPMPVPPLRTLIQVCTDLWPNAGAEAQDRHLGPLADELDLRRPEHLATAKVALASFVFVRPDGAGVADGLGPQHGRNPFELWCRRKPVPDVEIRKQIRAVGRAPMGVWSLEARVGDRWRVLDRLDLPAEYVPDGPVAIPELAAPWREPRPGDTLVARMVPSPDGWVATCAIAAPVAPPTRRLRQWLTLGLWEARLLDRRLTVDRFLGDFPQVLCRRVMEWAWLKGDEDPYRDPVVYDLEYADHDEDRAYYAGLARRFGGPVLELGCGTGRLSVEMARAGVSVEGVDLSEGMLSGLERRLAAEPPEVRARVRTRRADFRELTSDTRYPLIVWPFNAVHHCRSGEEVSAVLRAARALVADGGFLALDSYLPAPALYDRDPAERIEPRTFAHPLTGEPIESWEQGWWDEAQNVHHVVYIYRFADGVERHTHLQLRMYPLAELRRRVAEAGWRLAAQSEDFSGSPLGERSLKWVALLEAR